MLTRRNLLVAAPFPLYPRGACVKYFRPGGGLSRFTPDGTISDGTIGTSLVTGYGTWTWASSGHHHPVGILLVSIGRHSTARSSTRVRAPRSTSAARSLMNKPDQVSAGFKNYRFQFVGSPNLVNPGWPAPPIVTGPFTPSPDGSSITAPNGSLATADGIWAWGANTT